MNAGHLRVVIAEDNYLIREGTRRLLEDTGQIDVVATVPDAIALLAAMDRWQPDAVLTDIRMPPAHHTEGITAAHAIRNKYPGVGVVVLSQHAEAAYALELLKYGSAGLAYLLKERLGDVSHLLDALRATIAGGSVIDPIVVDAMVARRTNEMAAPLAKLTERELDVLREMAQGKTNTGIEHELFLSASTVEKHINSIFGKLDLADEPTVNRRVTAVLRFLKQT